MKRLFSLALAALIVLSLCACGSAASNPDDPIIGEWSLSAHKSTLGGQLSADELENLGVSATLECKASGSFEFTMIQNETTYACEGTWSAAEDGSYTFSDGSSWNAGGALDEELLTFTPSDGSVMEFTRG